MPVQGKAWTMETSDLAARFERNWPSGRVLGTTAELTLAGLGPRILTAGVKCGLLYRVRHGVYIKMDVWREKLPSQRDMLRLAAHFKATGGTSVYSHLSAARLLGLYIWNAGPAIHVTAPSSLSSTSAVAGITVHRRSVVHALHKKINHRQIGPVLVTNLEQTIVDCARTEHFVTAVIIGDSGLHRGASLDIMHQLLNALPGRRGVRAARKVLAALSTASESVGETRLRLVVAEMDVPKPEYQVWLQAAGNSYRVDGAWRDIKLALEFDGKTKYFAYKRTDEAIYEERQRERELMEAGWTFLRVEWKDLGNPELLRLRIIASMETARRRTALD